MKSKTQGFSIVECTIYSCLFAFFTGLVMHFVVISHEKNAGCLKVMGNHMSLCSCIDVLMQDLMLAEHRKSWKKKEANYYIWSLNTHDVGWLLKKRRLIRMHGHFNAQNQQWSKCTRCTIAQDIESFSLKRVDAVIELTLNAGNQCIKQKIKTLGT